MDNFTYISHGYHLHAADGEVRVYQPDPDVEGEFNIVALYLGEIDYFCTGLMEAKKHLLKDLTKK